MDMPLISREIGKDLRTASDEQLSQVVAIVDSMSARGKADDLIELVRPRLATLRPERPLTLLRALFFPLDAAIVPAPDWRPGAAVVPRSALGPLGHHITTSMGELAVELKQEFEGVPGGDRHRVQQIGARLWPAAAAAMGALELPRDWRHLSGLPEAAWPDLRDTVALVLSVAEALETLILLDADDAPLRRFLSEQRQCSVTALAVLLRILLARHRDPSLVLRAIGSFRDGQTTKAKDLAIASIIADAPGTIRDIGSGSATSAAAQATHLASILDAIDIQESQDRVRKLRAKALEACHGRLERCLNDDLLGAIQAPAAQDGTSISAAERAARDACRLERAARALGGQQQAQRLLKSVSSIVIAARSEHADPVDRARLLEILLGPDQAADLEHEVYAAETGLGTGA